MTTAGSLTRMPPSDSSAVKLSEDWVLNQNGSSDIVNPGTNDSVTFTFRGTQAGVFGVINPNGILLQPSINNISVAPFGYLPPTPRDRTSSQFYNTGTLSCGDYELTFSMDHIQHMHIDYFGFAPCLSSGDEPQSTTASSPAASSAGAPNTSTSPLSASASSPKPLSAGLVVGLVLSSFLLLLMLCGVALLLFMRRRQRSVSGTGLWAHLPGRGVPQSPSQALLSVGGGTDGVKDRPRTRFGLYMFKFKPASDTLMRDPSPPPATMTEGKTATPEPAPSQPQGWLGPSVKKPPQYTDGDWTEDPGAGGLVLRGYLPDTKEWIAPELEDGEQGDSSEWSTVPTNHAVESVPRGKPGGSSLWT